MGLERRPLVLGPVRRRSLVVGVWWTGGLYPRTVTPDAHGPSGPRLRTKPVRMVVLSLGVRVPDSEGWEPNEVSEVGGEEGTRGV